MTHELEMKYNDTMSLSSELIKNTVKVAFPFEKVSYDQFKKDMMDEFPNYFEESGKEEELRQMYDNIKLPTRSTEYAAGYDFYSPFPFTMVPGTTVKVPTGIRSRMDENWWLMMAPRSGSGFKYHIHLANTIGVIDSDYYYGNNEGHIMVKINFPSDRHPGALLNGDRPMLFGKSIATELPRKYEVGKSEKFAQGIFLPYGVTYDDDNMPKKKRTGGFGSTGKV